jgi:tetratricopeptide (TPR) repeat protein
MARYAINEFKDATKDFDRAINIDNNYIDAYYQRSLTWFARKKFEDALKDCDRIIARNPNHAEAYENKGNSLLNLKKKVEAKQALEQALKIYSQRNDNDSSKRIQQTLSQL